MKIEGEIMSTINKTTDYSQFQFYATNRKTIIDDLVASIKKENMLESFPILVNKDLYVIDGQHRLKAAMELNLPIYFIISDTLGEEHIPLCQIQKYWQLIDFYNYYYEKIEELKFIDQVVKITKDPLHLVLYSATGRKDPYIELRKGVVKLRKCPEELIKDFEKYVTLRDKVQILSPTKLTINIKRVLFEISYSSCYNETVMIKKVDKYPDEVMKAISFRDASNIKEWMMQKVYNRKR